MARKGILIVDDDADIRETLGEILHEEGYEVASVANGQEALDHLAQREVMPSLILLDLMMPVMNGWEFRSRQRADARIADVPVVIVTAGNVGEAAAHDESVEVLEKPVRLSLLLDVISRYSA